MTEAAIATIGDNAPPLAERLALDNEALIARAAAIEASAARMPATIGNDDDAGKAADLIRIANAADKALDNARTTAKEPFLTGGRTVDGFFSKHRDKITAAKKSVQGKLDAHVQRKADAERARRQEEARLARIEAERQAAAAQTEADLNRAVEQEDAARRAATAAAAKPAEMIRTRGEAGGLVTGRTTWGHEIADIHAIPLEALRRFFMPGDIDAAVRQFVRALTDAQKAEIAKGKQPLAGVRVFERTISMVR